VEAFVGCWIEGFHFYIHFDWIEATTKQKILLELKRFFFSLSIPSYYQCLHLTNPNTYVTNREEVGYDKMG
jgi:hypothetical protein